MDDLPQRVDALDAAVRRIAPDAALDRHPRIAPAERADGIETHGRGQPPAVADGSEVAPRDRVMQRHLHVDFGCRSQRRRGFDPPQTDAQLPDALGVAGTQTFEFAAAQLQDFGRCGRFARPRAIAFDLRQKGALILFETMCFGAITTQDARQRQRDGQCIEKKEFFHEYDGFPHKITPRAAVVFLYFRETPVVPSCPRAGPPLRGSAPYRSGSAASAAAMRSAVSDR